LSVERNLVISVLRIANEGPVLTETVNKDARIPSETSSKLLRKLQNEGLIYLKEDSIDVDSKCRLKLALKAISLGADIEQVSNLLYWREFEEIAALALRNNGYNVQKNVRFKHSGRRWEIDVVGCKKPIVLCIDCKHWQRAIASSVLKRMAEEQTERTKALADSLPNVKLKLECTKWERAKFIPCLLSLIPSSFKFYDKVPVVPVLQIQDFISQLPAYVEAVKFIPKKFRVLTHDFQD
jgi:Holliday junction resolvase-like predicted endonuclease